VRILYVCSDSEVAVLGTEGCSIHVQALSNALVAAGHEVLVACSWLGDGDPRALAAPAVELRPRGHEMSAWERMADEPLVQDHHLERDLRSLAWNHWCLDQADDLLDGTPPDVVYERFALFGWAGLALARRYGVPHLLELNAPLSEEQAGYHRFTLTETARRMEAEVVSSTDAVLAVSPWLRDWALRLGATADRVHVVPNAVDAAHFAVPPDGGAARAALGIDDRRVVGYLGSFQPWHHLSGLVRAFAELVRDGRDAHLLLVGDGPRRAATSELAAELGVADAVTFTGHVEHERALELLGAIDVAVVPYAATDDFYFSPLKLFECMAAGCATVAARIGQIEEVIDHGRTGWLYAPGDDAELATALRALVADAGRELELGSAGRREILSSRTWKNVARRVEQLTEELAGAPA
jgi:glycosyltransferase involved in cell wall biosynthesis